MKAGVSIIPCGVVRRPSLAPVGSVANTSNRNDIRTSVAGEVFMPESRGCHAEQPPANRSGSKSIQAKIRAGGGKTIRGFAPREMKQTSSDLLACDKKHRVDEVKFRHCSWVVRVRKHESRVETRRVIR